MDDTCIRFTVIKSLTCPLKSVTLIIGNCESPPNFFTRRKSLRLKLGKNMVYLGLKTLPNNRGNRIKSNVYISPEGLAV